MNVAILGLGLIGGSIGLAARQRLSARVRGWNRSPGPLERALELGAIDEPCENLEEAVATSDVCFVCTSVATLGRFVRKALEAGGDAVVTDVGSVKQRLVSELEEVELPRADLQRFVGGHPLAGAEVAGVDNARSDLFDGATWYLTPSDYMSGVLYERLFKLVGALGARPVPVSARGHDRLMAAVSHLPHVLANVLVSQAASALAEESQALPATGPSFRDATRVAGANPSLWQEIFLSNRDALIAEIDSCRAELEGVRRALTNEDSSRLDEFITLARDHRHKLLDAELAGGDVSELRVSVPNEPGVVAKVSLALASAGVNIVDMALYPAPDMQSGAIALWVGADGAEQAVGLIDQLGYPVSVVNEPGG